MFEAMRRDNSQREGVHALAINLPAAPSPAEGQPRRGKAAR